jgi:acetoin utilization protein AcuB
MDKVSKWMKKALTIEDNVSLIEAIHLMKEENLRHLPVMHKERLVGLLTEYSIQRSTPGKATSLDTWELHYLLSKVPVKQAMITDPYTVSDNAYMIEAVQLMHDKKLYGLCVINEQGNLAGILTITDVLEAFLTLCKEGRAAVQ